MHFITNHDENSWNGTIEERLGLAAEAMAVLAFTFDGMPLIYSGQEAGLDKRLKFFEKDFIEWGEIPLAPFYATLLDLKHRNRALWNGAYGGQVRKIQTGNDDDIYAFYRERGGDKAIVVLNLSGNYQDIVLQCNACTGTYTNLFANSTINVTKDMMLHLNPWDYVVWTNK
jgi:alpha-amylase